MTHTIEVERWCPECQKVFSAVKLVGRRTREETSTQALCPKCGSQGQLLLDVNARRAR